MILSVGMDYARLRTLNGQYCTHLYSTSCFVNFGPSWVKSVAIYSPIVVFFCDYRGKHYLFGVLMNTLLIMDEAIRIVQILRDSNKI